VYFWVGVRLYEHECCFYTSNLCLLRVCRVLKYLRMFASGPGKRAAGSRGPQKGVSGAAL
jgi:hypothetical protein